LVYGFIINVPFFAGGFFFCCSFFGWLWCGATIAGTAALLAAFVAGFAFFIVPVFVAFVVFILRVAVLFLGGLAFAPIWICGMRSMP
jgi:hypothetical protein